MVELTNIAANIMSDQEAATGMFLCECLDIKYDIIEKDKLLAVGDPLIELISQHRFPM